MQRKNVTNDESKKRVIKSTSQVILNVPYGLDKAQTLDIYLPPGRSVSSTKIFVIIHGGGFNSGSRDELTAYVQPMQRRLDNYAFFNLSYRQATSADTLFPTQENDVKAALQFIINHSEDYCVSKKMILLGVSAGGLLALLQGYKYKDPVIPKAIISFEPWLKTTTPAPEKEWRAEPRGPAEARRPLRMHPVRLLHHRVPELLVEFGALSRPGRAAAGQPLDRRQPRRGDRRAARQSRGPVPAVPLPHHHELLQGLPEGPQSGQVDRRDQEAHGRAAGLVVRAVRRIPAQSRGPALSRRTAWL